MTRKKVDLVEVIEAAYGVDVEPTEWLSRVLNAARPALDAGMGVTGFFYDASDVRQLRIHSVIGAGDRSSSVARAIEKSAPERVKWTFRTQACRFASEGPDWQHTPARSVFEKWGIQDVLFVNGLDPTGHGCFMTAPQPKKTRIHTRTLRTWERIAAHLAAGHRLLRRAKHPADATLDPSGRMQDGTPETTVGAVREKLRAATIAMDRARSNGREEPHESIAEWKALTDARWTLIDHFDTDGKRYVIARRNEASLPEAEALSPRERQVLAYAALGHSNKLVAYELGISPSTVGVLLHRAAAKLRATTRAELVAKYETLAATDRGEDCG